MFDIYGLYAGWQEIEAPHTTINSTRNDENNYSTDVCDN